MTDDTFDQIREKDHAVLQCIQDGRNNTRTIREATTLSNRDVNYSLDKLEDLDLIETETPNGRVTLTVDGQKRNFKAPRQTRLTETGFEYLASRSNEQTRFQGMTYDELVNTVQDLEKRIDEIEDSFEAFRKQVVGKLQ